LREDELAARFGVSRHPIRKVLQQLTLEGLLIAKPNCGATVAAERAEHIEALLVPMRVQLELYALQQAVSGELQAHRRDWESIVKRMERAAEDGDEQGVLSLDAEFHQQLFKAAGMDDFIPLWAAIFGRMRGYHLHGNRTWGDLRTVAFVHERLLESILSDDPAKAADDLRSHLERGEFNRRAKAAWERHQRREPRR
jgi:DNA-binding GntR family transcriptional regulator